MEDVCQLCSLSLQEGDTKCLTDKGKASLQAASLERGDGKHETMLTIPPAKVHITCYKDYTRKTSISSFKRKVPSDKSEIGDTARLRSMSQEFDIKTHCLYCAKIIDTSTRSPKIRRREYSCVETIEYVKSLITRAKERNDEWGTDVLVRVEAVNDLIAEEAKYHHDCALEFRRCIVGKVNEVPGKSHKEQAFDKLIEYLEQNDECQYTLNEITELMDSYLDGEDGYSVKNLKWKLEKYFGSDIVVTKFIGTRNVITFRDKNHRILKDNWEREAKANVTSEKDRIIDMAASIIRDDIRTATYDTEVYPMMDSCQDWHSDIPGSLNRLMHGIIKSKSKVKSNEKRCTSIAHAIISACRPRSFVSPILLSTAIYIHRRYASRELIDILNALGFSDDYREVRRFNSTFIENEPSYNLTGFTQMVFDNADHNIATLTGHDTFHSMGGIACVTPPGEHQQNVIRRPITVPSASVIGSYGKVPIHTYRKPFVPGLKSINITALEITDKTESVKLAERLDCFWRASYILKPANCPLWSGFMQIIYDGENSDMSRVEILPFINLDPTKETTIYTALCFAKDQIEKAGQSVCPVTFDQPLYMKASEIIAASPELKTCLVTRLGGFHLIMSYMGAIGYIMGGSGLDVLWQTVYAGATVQHMLNGHAYARALRAHFLTSAALTTLLLSQPHSLDDVDTNQLCQKFSELLDKDRDVHDIKEDLLVKDFVDVIERASVDVAAFRTGKLWMNYIRQITILKLFIHAERSGDWDLHLYAISQMIPYLHAAGHTQYAKSARLYHQTMKTVQSVMSEDDYARFTTRGYFTIRRTHHFWSGNFTDQTIEQDLMRMLKSAGGMTHGREITDSTLTNWVHSFPLTIPICKSLEQFTNVNCTSSYQHRDLNAGSESKDKRDHEAFYMWLSAHSPFDYTCESVVCLSTGMIADKTVNCDNAFEVGCIAASAMTNGNFSDVKLKRNDKVKTIASMANTVVIRNERVTINPAVLFDRITCILRDSSEMEVYLSYELAPHPPSLFQDGLMRKSPKSALGQLLRSKAPLESRFPDNAMYIVDGGYLLRVVIWPANATYSQVCDEYVSYTERHYGNEAIVVFDGYECTTSTKSAEQKRRATKSSSRDIMFDESMQTVTTQSAFLSNDGNKTRLISMLVQKFNDKFIKTRQAAADADRLIVETALSKTGYSQPVVVIGTDTDLLVMLISLAPPDCDMYMLCSTNPTALYNITRIQNAVGNKKPHLLFAHSVTGCDTVSALFGVGKKKAIDILDQYTDDDSLNVFTNETSSKEQIATVGEKFILKLYGAPKSVDKLNKQRYLSYNKSIRRSSLTTAFKLESLAPTSRAAYFHSLRTYLQVQQWIGNTLDATKWGWYLQDGTLKPVETDQPAAPDTLLKMVACGCDVGKGNCGRMCGCRKLALKCGPGCRCAENEQFCSNAPSCEADNEEQ